MPLITGPGRFHASLSAPSFLAPHVGKAWFVTRWLLRRSPPAAAAVLAGNAIYYALRALSSNDDQLHVAGAGGLGGFIAEITVPPMWARDP